MTKLQRWEANWWFPEVGEERKEGGCHYKKVAWGLGEDAYQRTILYLDHGDSLTILQM